MTNTIPSNDHEAEIDVTDEWAEWPESDLDIDDEAFAEAIARGRSLEAAA